MRENEFEQRVKQKMADFNLHPSNEVWMEVERRIRREKKRRFIFWWPIFLLLVAGGIATAVLLVDKKNTVAKDADEGNTHTATTTTSTKKNTETISATDRPATSSDNNNTMADTAKQSIAKNKSAISIVAGPVPENRMMANSSIPSRQAIEKGNGAKGKATANVKPPVSTQGIITTTENPSVDTATTVVSTAIISPKKKTAVIGQKISAAQLNEKTVNEKEPTVSKKDKKIKKWQTEINVSAGRSSVVDGFGVFKSASNADAQALSPSGPFNNVAASAVRPGISFGAGVAVTRPLSKKLEISLGAGYSFLSTRMTVGNRVDSLGNVANLFLYGSSVSTYYGAQSNHLYHNQYHFLSFSGDLLWRVADGKKLKIDWKTGLQYRQLLGSTMLHFERRLPGYYQDNNRLNKSQVFLSTGLSVPVSNKFRVNPFVGYSLTPVLKNAAGRNIHYAEFGIRFSFLVNKK